MKPVCYINVTVATVWSRYVTLT